MTDPSHRIVRALFLSGEVKTLMDGPWKSADGATRSARLQADFEVFVRGEPVAMCLVPRKHGNATFGRLAEPEEEIWDFRSRQPLPVLRIFGRFAAPDTFIGFHWRPRIKPWNGRSGLGAYDSIDWKQAKDECKNQWELLFPDHTPIHGDDIHDYVTDENAYDIVSE